MPASEIRGAEKVRSGRHSAYQRARSPEPGECRETWVAWAEVAWVARVVAIPTRPAPAWASPRGESPAPPHSPRVHPQPSLPAETQCPRHSPELQIPAQFERVRARCAGAAPKPPGLRLTWACCPVRAAGYRV